MKNFINRPEIKNSTKFIMATEMPEHFKKELREYSKDYKKELKKGFKGKTTYLILKTFPSYGKIFFGNLVYDVLFE